MVIVVVTRVGDVFYFIYYGPKENALFKEVQIWEEAQAGNLS
jgi:hypothetical protein